MFQAIWLACYLVLINNIISLPNEWIMLAVSWSIMHVIIWLAPRAGKMKQILCSDWLPGGARCRGLSCLLGISRFVPAEAKFFGIIFWPHNKSFIDQACSVKMAVYWNLANIQPSWPHAWSITHISKQKQNGGRKLTFRCFPVGNLKNTRRCWK